MKLSIIGPGMRSGWDAVETRPASVMLKFCWKSAGCVRLYGSKGFRPRAKFSVPAAPLATPPTKWLSSTASEPM